MNCNGLTDSDIILTMHEVFFSPLLFILRLKHKSYWKYFALDTLITASKVKITSSANQGSAQSLHFAQVTLYRPYDIV